ncbi:hypothetical protein JTB14_027421 [Gonioctena quinquepunctata]|nr:hypothetical protein JTB14_027421 [Gonioctena quinquepunctata]
MYFMQEKMRLDNDIRKIDASTLMDMPEETLKIHTAKYGDRIATKTFCKLTMSTSKGSSLIEEYNIAR